MDHRTVPVAAPDAPPGTCRHCEQPCSPRARAHAACKKEYTRRWDYRAHTPGPQICVDADEHCTPVLQSDHIVALADGGRHDWRAWRCTHHHAQKTKGENMTRAATRTRTATRTRSRGARTPPTPLSARAPVRARARRGWRARLGAVMVTVAGADLAAGWVGSVCAAGVCAVVWCAWWQVRARRARRAAAITRARLILAARMSQPWEQVHVQALGWERVGGGLVPMPMRVTYPALFDDGNDTARRAVVKEAAAKFGGAVVASWETSRDRLTLTRPTTPSVAGGAAPVAVPQPADADHAGARRDVTAKVVHGLSSLLRCEVTVTPTRWDGDRLTGLTVTYPAAAAVHKASTREEVTDKVQSLLPGRWVPAWDTQAGTVTYIDAGPDPLAATIACPPIPQVADLATWSPGLTETGAPATLALTYSNTLIVGASGAGKGSLIWSIVRSMAPALIDGTARLVVIDPKGGMELGRLRCVATQFAVDPASAVRVLESTAAAMSARAEQFGSAGVRKFTPTTRDPYILVIVDELLNVTVTQPPKIRVGVEANLMALLTQGRAVGYGVVAATQNPEKEVLKLRPFFLQGVALRLNSKTHVDMVLGEEMRANGARCDQIVDAPGMGFCVVNEDAAGLGVPVGRPVRFRAPWTSDADVQVLVDHLEAGSRS